MPLVSMWCFVLASLTVFHLNLLVECTVPDPLILTPLLEAGKFKEAQRKALVVPDIQGVKSYAGYFTVNKECGNNLFFWFTPAENNFKSAPVVLWLNGGPGCTSLYGFFHEIGPFDFIRKKGFVKREQRWSKDHHVLFLDQPAGTGFSFTTKDCYAKDLSTVAQEAYQAVLQFFLLFPNFQKNKFFITGESFGGHYIPALALEIDKENANAALKINLVGVMVGNPAIDERCHHNAAYLYELGIVDENTRDLLLTLEGIMADHINKGEYKMAARASRQLYGNISLIELPSPYNILYDKVAPDDFQLFVRQYATRKLIHVGQTPFTPCSDPVYAYLEEDIFTPTGMNIQKLLVTGKYTVGFYSGQLDLVCMYTSVPCVLRQLEWPGAADYMAANRSLWYVGDRLAGWYKTAGNLFEVVVRDSGHFVPTDQPDAVLDLLKAFVAVKPGTKQLKKLKTELST